MSKTTTAYNCTITFTETEVEALARGELPPAVQAAAIGLLRLGNSTPAQTVEHSNARPPLMPAPPLPPDKPPLPPPGKECRTCHVRWAQPNTGGRCSACYRQAVAAR
jgi:hypothetical protein